MENIILILGLGAGVGLISSILGLGGGILIVPLLVSISDIPHTEVVATSLATIFCVVSVNTFFFHRESLIVWRVALTIGVATAFGALIGASLGIFFSAKVSQSVLFIVLVVCLFRLLFLKQWNKLFAGGKEEQERFKYIAWGILAGSLSGMTGIGSGVIIVSVLLGVSSVETEKISPTANAVMVFTTLFGTLHYASGTWDLEAYRMGYVHLNIALMLFLGAITMAVVGRRYQHYLSHKLRSWLLCLLLCFLSYQVGTQLI